MSLSIHSESESDELSPIQKFFSGKSIFLTGGTGFLGKVLTEKLLRSCSSLNKIYLLIRLKRNVDPESRYEKIISEVLFDELRKQNPKFSSKIVLIPGDCSEANLGISEEHRKLLSKNVDVVIHAAATVRFDENLKQAIKINVCATREVIKLCHTIEKLESFVYVSTSYSRCYSNHVKEEVEQWNPEYEDVISKCNQLTEKEVDKKLKYVWRKWPNTYTYTKAVAECFVKREEGRLPCCIFRPGIVVGAMSEPIPGWVDNYLGATGISLGAATGAIKVIQGDYNVHANIVPVDLVTNGILVSAYDTAKNFKNEEKDIKVYNYSSATDNPLSFRDYTQYLWRFTMTKPPLKSIWYYSLILCNIKPLYYVLSFFLHWVPALLNDIAAIASGKKPVTLKMCKKIEFMIEMLSFFVMNDIVFQTTNVHSLWDRTTERDKKIFNFDIMSINWPIFMDSYFTGARIWTLKDDLNTVKMARKRMKRLYWYHQSVKLVLFILSFLTLSFVVQNIFPITVR